MNEANKLGLGKIITTEQHRDAVHIAVAPVEAKTRFRPGYPVSLDQDGKAYLGTDPVGIVDPFLQDAVQPGQRFWLFLFPGSITSLRHEWTHPAFCASDERYESEKWLRSYAEDLNNYEENEQAYQMLIEGLRSGRLFVHGSHEVHVLRDLEHVDELQYHAERVLGTRIDLDQFSFSCSC